MSILCIEQRRLCVIQQRKVFCAVSISVCGVCVHDRFLLEMVNEIFLKRKKTEFLCVAFRVLQNDDKMCECE